MRLILFTALVLSSLSFAHAQDEKSMLWPRVTFWPTSVDLFISNPTQDDYNCSGTIFITHASRRMSTQYYFGRVYARGFEQRKFFSRFINDRIVNATHSIYCNRI